MHVKDLQAISSTCKIIHQGGSYNSKLVVRITVKLGKGMLLRYPDTKATLDQVILENFLPIGYCHYASTSM